MAIFCHKCGTQANDDESIFCQKCGTQYIKNIPEKKDDVCSSCGTKILDKQSIFCNKCGSKLSTAQPVITQSIKRGSFDNEESIPFSYRYDSCTPRAIIFILVSLPLFWFYLSNPQTNSLDIVFGLLFLGGGVYIIANRHSPWVCVTAINLFSILIGVVFLFLPTIQSANNPGTNTFLIIVGLIFLGSGVYSFVQNRGGF